MPKHRARAPSPNEALEYVETNIDLASHALPGGVRDEPKEYLRGRLTSTDLLPDFCSNLHQSLTNMDKRFIVLLNQIN